MLPKFLFSENKSALPGAGLSTKATFIQQTQGL